MAYSFYVLCFFFYRVLAHLFYWVGEFASRVPTYFAYWVYQVAMRESIKYDDKSGQTVWKEVE